MLGNVDGDTGALAIGLSCSIIDGMLAATQGVKRGGSSHALLGNLAQDVAAIRLPAELGREYMDRHGHPDVAIYDYMLAVDDDFPAR